MSGRVARRCTAVPQSVTVALNDRVKELRARGTEVLDIGGGDPGFDTPGHISAAASDALFAGFTHYTASRGLPELRQAISEKLRRDNGVEAAPDTQILVTPSSKHALFTALMATLDPGDEVLVPTPSWGSYRSMARLAGAVPVCVELSARDAFTVTRSRLEEHVSPRTKVLVLNTPNNPTGRVLGAPEADTIAAFAAEHDLLIITDEIYEKILFSGEHLSMAARPDCADRTVTVNGFSKGYAMPGWRLGYAAGPPDIISAMLAVHQHTVACAGSFVQTGGVAALRGPQGPLREAVRAYAARAGLVTRRLNELVGVVCPAPAGTFYAFADISGTGIPDGDEFAERLLAEAAVAVTPGSAFGPGGRGHIRVSFTAGPRVLEEALARLAAFVRDRAPGRPAPSTRM
ncbi:pyridoxal phosphate-dependent aminotransferase [Streptomyces sp. NPDC007901]|uniref:pyridoxal phosphate-dependent aminotransferase n=1 Tax=Streptomyces sp. NPDC007901 TaxID=3364785 RepID=UPI0036E7ECEB